MKKVIISFYIIFVSIVCGAQLTKDEPLNYSILYNTFAQHYTKPVFDDAYSEKVFDEYFKRLDAHKRFFLMSDVVDLSSYKTQLDDEFLHNDLLFFSFSQSIFKKRVAEVKEFLPELFSDLHYYKYDLFETDAKKRDFPATNDDRKQYWKSFIKYQIINTYFTLVDQDVSENTTETAPIISMDLIDPVLEKKAQERVSKNINESLTRLLEMDKEEDLQYYYDSLLSVLDTYSSYFPPERKEDFDISISGKLEGIGAVLREDDGFIVVDRIILGSACWKQGELKAGDKVLKVAQGAGEPVDMIGLRVRDAVKYIRGKKGTEVRLTVQSASGKIMTIPIIRDVVEIEETYAKSVVITDERFQRKMGYIELPKFYRDFKDSGSRNTTTDVEKQLNLLKEQGVEGIILDLRNNEGGALLDAINTAGLFIKSGPIVQVKNRDGSTRFYEDPDSSIVYDGPLIILVNRLSASASEILAAALQDYHRAVIVGSESSFGKGTVQTFIDLDAFIDQQVMYAGKPAIISEFKPYGALKITIEKFYRINGGSTQEKGVIPDIILPDLYGYIDIGERYNPHALKWDTIDEVPYRSWDLDLNLEMLKQKSNERTVHDSDFKEVSDHIDFLKQTRDVTIEPLNIKKAYEKREAINDEDDHFKTVYDDTFPHMQFTEVEEYTVSKNSEEASSHWYDRLAKDLYLNESLAILNDLIDASNE